MCLLILALAAVSASGAEPTRKEPTLKEPAGPLAVRDQEESTELFQAAFALYEQLDRDVGQMRSRMESGKLKGVKLQVLGEMECRLMQLQRAAGRLSRLGEAAGGDLVLRAAYLGNDLSAIKGAWRVVPENAQQLSGIVGPLIAQTEKRKKDLAKAEALAKEGKWEEAQEVLLRVIYELHRVGVWVDLNVRPYGAFVALEAKTEPEAVAAVVTRAADQALVDRTGLKPDWQALEAQIGQATQALGSNGKADVDGQSLEGPEALASFTQRWKALHVNACRCLALDWALDHLRQTDSNASGFVSEQHRFHEQLAAALAGLIEADAGRADAAAAENLYPRYVRNVAALAALSAGSALADRLEPALQKLAERSPRLAGNVQAYALATDDLLRWRQRTAEAYAQKHRATYPPLDDRFTAAAGAQGENIGVKLISGAGPFGGQQMAAAPKIMADAESLVGQKVAVQYAMGPRANSKLRYSPVRGLTYARIPVDEQLAQAAAALADDLLVVDSAPPLTLDAAVALESAAQGDLAAAGGEIRGVGLNSLIPRFETLQDTEWGLAPLGPLNLGSGERHLGARVLVRCDVVLQWAQHRYFFIAYPAAD
jgi:hypothetical protein